SGESARGHRKLVRLALHKPPVRRPIRKAWRAFADDRPGVMSGILAACSSLTGRSGGLPLKSVAWEQTLVHSILAGGNRCLRAEIVGDERFEIVEVDACPAHWSAKVHAVHAGVTRSRGAADADYLLFADADTLFSPGCIAASVAMLRHRSLDMLSLLSTLTHD